jgi:hypothetical protein
VFGERHRHLGEFIGSGTVANGCGLEFGWYLEPGDSIELEVEKIGILKNRLERQSLRGRPGCFQPPERPGASRSR